MPTDGIKVQGPAKRSLPDTGGGVLLNTPVFAVVKDNVDATRSGRIRVYIEGMSGTDPTNADSWITVRYLMNFYGHVENTAADASNGDYVKNAHSYGMWASSPDLESTVICIFVNGDINRGFYIGHVPFVDNMHMVPAIGSNNYVIPNSQEAQSYGGAPLLPVTNINTDNTSISYTGDFFKKQKPVHSYVAMAMFQQGVIRDPVRGPITSSANRESPSRVGWGVSSPGRPIFEGGATDEDIADKIKAGEKQSGLKIIARRGGHSIVLDDGDTIGQNNLIRLRSSLGHQITMSDDGQCLFIMHANGQSWVELGKEGTIDMFSMNSVNVRTLGDLNLHADNDINIHAIKDLNIRAETINVNSVKNTNHRIGEDYIVHTVGKYTHKVEKQMSQWSVGPASYHSDDITFINGKRIHLNTGETSTVPQKLVPIPLVLHTDTLFDKIKGWVAAPNKLKSITNRAPAHQPWVNSNQGVNVKIDNKGEKVGEGTSTPSPPSSGAAATNSATSAAPVTAPTSPALASTVPAVTSPSGAIDPNTASAMVSQTASTAASAAPTSITKGGDVIDSVPTVGALAHTSDQLQKANVLKPTASAISKAVAAKLGAVDSSLSPNLFTGIPGGETYEAYRGSLPAQLATQTDLFRQSQTELSKAGYMTGTESPTTIAGAIMAGANKGIKDTLNTIKMLSYSTGIPINVTMPKSVSSIINAGNMAANMAQLTSGGLGALTGALKSMGGGYNPSIGAAASAFAATAATFSSLTPNKPQTINSNVIGDTIRKIDAAGINTIASAAAGVSNIPGAMATLGTPLNKAAGANNLLPGMQNIAGLINTAKSFASGSLDKKQSILTSALLGKNATSALLGLNSAANNISGSLNALKNAKDLSSGISAVNNLMGNFNASLNVASRAINTLGSVSGGLGSLPGIPGIPNIPGLPNMASLPNMPSMAEIQNSPSITSALNGLPASITSPIQAAMASASAGGQSEPTKVPTIAVNTVDRSSVDSRIDALLEEPIVPNPNYTGLISPNAKSSLEQNNAIQLEVANLIKETESIYDKAKAIGEQYYQAQKIYLPGSPELIAIKQQWDAAVAEADNKIQSITYNTE